MLNQQILHLLRLASAPGCAPLRSMDRFSDARKMIEKIPDKELRKTFELEWRDALRQTIRRLEERAYGVKDLSKSGVP